MRISGTREGSRRGRGVAVVALLVLAVGSLAVGCSGPGDDSSSGDADGASDVASGSSGSGGAATPAAVSPESVQQGAGEGRKRTFTANMALGVERVDRAVEDAGTAVAAVGGFTSSEDVDLDGDGRASATYRVPADRFDAALEALGALGEVRTKDVKTDDVTAQYADLDSRVAALRTSVDRLHGFLAQATDVNQIAIIEGELTRREAELESTEGQRRALAEQVELSTITVAFESLDGAIGELPTFLGGLETGRDAAAAVVAAAAATAGFLVPFLPPVALAFLAVVVVRRRRRRLAPVAEPPV